ncbi:MAG: antitoxin VbhA family protein [Ruminococcus sp.]|uniref:antitoxin VbhA family protein n=1 Tax=Ruminococcus sp. TaxID=41978 RepID=UPI0025CDEE38|nr:antitoxin VbhA family protein [Ruminococcus sp.]MCR5541176.1 antitoxin VbhA family protein [Ruminococcus sp.]
MESNSKSKSITNIIHKQRVQNIAGTMAIEELTLSEASRRNLDRYASGQVNFQQIMAELKAKYQRTK